MPNIFAIIPHQLELLQTNIRRLHDAKIGLVPIKEWLASKEFGGSRYLADSAMTISLWYDDLPDSMQRLVASRVDSWSIAALKELPKLTIDMVEKLVRSGKHTAKKIRCIAFPTTLLPKKKFKAAKRRNEYLHDHCSY